MRESGKGSVSIAPSTFTEDNRPASTSGSDDIRITNKWSIHPFRKMMGMVTKSQGGGYNSTMRAYTKIAAEDGWKDDRISRLRKLTEKVDEIALLLDNFCLDADLEFGPFRPAETDPSRQLCIRVWGRRVMDDLGAQAIYCGLPVSVYAQLRIIDGVLAGIDQAKAHHKACIDLGASADPLLRSLKRFNEWLDFREMRLSGIVERYGSSARGRA